MTLCPHCASEVSKEQEVCPICNRELRDDTDVDVLKPGTVLIERYRIVTKLGQGGFGITYIADDTQTGDTVVIKEFFYTNYCRRDTKANTVLVSGGGKNALNFKRAKERAIREAQTLTVIKHDNIVKAYQYFESNNTVYTVMEYVEGEELYRVIKQSKALDTDKALFYFIQLLEALQAIHRIGVIHRDIKPQNILITPKEKIKLIDFGTIADVDEKSREITNVQSQGFAPLEINLKHTKIQPCYDIYAVGMTLYCMLSGKVDNISTPVSRQSMDDIAIEINNMSIDDTLKSILLKAIAIQPEERYQSVDEILPLFDGKVEASDMKSLDDDKSGNTKHSFSSTQDSPKDKLDDKSTTTSKIWTKVLGAIMGIGILYVLYLMFYPTYDKQNYQYFLKSCDGGDMEACNELGECYKYGIGDCPKEDKQKSIKYFKKACDNSYSNGCYSLGYMYENEIDDQIRDINKALQYYQKACNIKGEKKCQEVEQICKNHHLEECKNIIASSSDKNFMIREDQETKNKDVLLKGEEVYQLYKNGKKEKANKQAQVILPQLEKLCKDNNVKACGLVGVIYNYQEQYGKAFGYSKKACDAGNMRGCLSLARAYDFGKGVGLDRKEAYVLLKKSCEKGLKDACFIVGLKYLYGEGVNRNIDKAIKEFKKLCSKKDHQACNELISIYSSKNEYPEYYDISQAILISKQACNSGELKACKKLNQYQKLQKSDILNQLSDFMEAYYQSSKSNNPMETLYYYDDYIKQYFSLYNVSKEDILKDKLNFYKKWTQRQYSLQHINLIRQKVLNGIVHYFVTTEINWKVSSLQYGTKEGKSYDAFEIIKKENRFFIVSVKTIDQMIIKDTHSNHLVFKNEQNGIILSLSYPSKVQAGGVIILTAKMKNSINYAIQGGLTLSFPDKYTKKGVKIIKGDFETINIYTSSNKVYSKTLDSTMYPKYVIVEGWQHDWYKGEEKTFITTIKVPKTITDFRVNIRGILWMKNRYNTRKNPEYSSGIFDQQGFSVKQIDIQVYR